MSLSKRTDSKTVTFHRPFMLRGIDGVQPAGCYVVETNEELDEDVSPPAACRRLMTVILLPLRSGKTGPHRIANIDALELEVALERDAMKIAR